MTRWCARSGLADFVWSRALPRHFPRLDPMASSRDLKSAWKTERRDDTLELSSLQDMKVSSPEESGSFRCICMPPASTRSAHPSMKTRMTLTCFVHRSVRNLAITAALWIRSSAGRVHSKPKRNRAAQQRSVTGLLACDSMPERAKRAESAPSRTVRV